MMQVIPGGAVARPFVTYHNALDMELYLRVAPELYLKRLVVGGFERVFEINRNFRNEGLSTQHNPEFTMLEFYQAYADYNDLMDLTQEMIREAARTVHGDTRVVFQEREFDLGQPFERLSVEDSILRFNPNIDATRLRDIDYLSDQARVLGIALENNYGLGKVMIEIFEKTVEPNLDQPTFITAYPTEVSPLSRRSDSDPFVTDRFEFFINGDRAREWIFRTERSGRPSRSISGSSGKSWRGRSGGHVLRCRLHLRLGTRSATHGGRGCWYRSSGHVSRESHLNTRCAVVPAHAGARWRDENRIIST